MTGRRRTTSRTYLHAITRRNDVLLASLLVAIVFMMILPLPTELIDVLIGVSMGIAVILLMLAIYISSAAEFFAFPAVLLLTTLFRLALSISTTRLVLLQADAGAIIDTFGNFVVAGNLVVGIVIFLIITIVQFLVITKGAERVAEVSARFSLDAMPGKQMSIDGDMRAGVIDMDEARRRREKVEKESQLYGSMDGAMKFVKGDAIAGLIIIAVNLVGGLVIGMTQRGLALEEAVQIYSILTIGDGLVAQIPALLIAMTAGVIVTRVSTEETENLASDIGQQFGAQPKALLVAAGLMVAFSLIPGFPTKTFLALAAVTGGAGLLLLRSVSRRKADEGESRITSVLTPVSTEASSEAEVDAQLRGEQEITLGAPLLVDISASVQEHLDMRALNREAARVRRALYLDLGVPFPGVHVRFNENLPERVYAILLQEIPVARGDLRPGYVLYADHVRQLDVLGLPSERGDPFLPNIPTVWIEDRYADSLRRGVDLVHGSPQGAELSPRLRDAALRGGVHRYPGDLQPVRTPAADISGPHQGGAASAAGQPHHRGLQAARRGGHLDPQRPLDTGVPRGVGPAGEGRGHADGVRARRSQAIHQLQVQQRSERAVGPICWTRTWKRRSAAASDRLRRATTSR